MAMQTHGGLPQEGPVYLDFSVNINPLGMPEYVREKLLAAVKGGSGLWERYPDPACGDLRRSLAGRLRISPERIVCGNGASELLMALVRMLQCRKGREPLRCLLPVPSFYEYERALLAAGAGIVFHLLREEEDFALTERLLEELDADTDLLFLCNPNNPTGALAPEGLLARILDVCLEKDIVVILDECFLELSGGRGDDLHCESGERPNLIVLKAFTKLYAIPGLRLGYCICPDRELAEAVTAQLPCWNVSGPALLAGLTVMENEKDIDYISQSVETVKRERRYLEKRLKALGMRVLPGQANFICFHSPLPLYEGLLRKGILIRDCSGFRGMGAGWYRTAVRDREENALLIEALGQERRDRGWDAI